MNNDTIKILFSCLILIALIGCNNEKQKEGKEALKYTQLEARIYSIQNNELTDTSTCKYLVRLLFELNNTSDDSIIVNLTDCMLSLSKGKNLNLKYDVFTCKDCPDSSKVVTPIWTLGAKKKSSYAIITDTLLINPCDSSVIRKLYAELEEQLTGSNLKILVNKTDTISFTLPESISLNIEEVNRIRNVFVPPQK